MSLPEFYAEPPAVAAPAPSVRPYGFFGLILSFAALCLLGAALLAAAYGVWLWLAGAGPVQQAMAGLSGIDLNEIRKTSHQTQILFYAITAATFVAFGLAALVVAFVRGGRDWRIVLAWGPIERDISIRAVLLFAAAALIYVIVAGFGIKLIRPEFRTWFFIPEGGAGILLSLVTVALLAPLVEEMIFRGWIFSSLKRSFGRWAAIVVTAIVFAAVHLDATGLYPLLIFLPGLALTLIRDYAGSARASFLAHAGYNLLAWLVVFFVGNP